MIFRTIHNAECDFDLVPTESERWLVGIFGGLILMQCSMYSTNYCTISVFAHPGAHASLAGLSWNAA